MSVKVAVRVRPFNEREKFLGCICCVEMKENTTILYQNKQKNKKQHYFTFDHSFWSHDEFHLCPDGYMKPMTPKYIDQQGIYNIIGKEILEDSWQGYNCCLFAYGQTGAGKSYSMLGYGVNRGIVPMVCQQIFYKIRKNQKKGVKQYQVTLSMLEIYNEKVQDLFVPTNKRPPTGLKIRQNKTLGVYVEGLTKYEVFSYRDIEKHMEEGNRHRSLASTLMNEYSSRAHTIIMLEFIQKQWINKAKMNKKSSYINLVDLAGSQRVSKTGIVDNKDRLKEASNINKSLHTLGRVIEALAEQAAGKGKTVQVPYRDSALTRILESALGGNSKTLMICAISPANDNYEQTLSTLRYADQAKKIKNKPIVNESAVDKIIRQLREENERLKKMLETSEQNSLANSRALGTQSQKREMRSNLRASMREVQRQIKKNLKSFAINTDQIEEDEESLMMTEFIDLQGPSQFFSELSFDLGNKAQVYITNLNEDELLNDKVRYSCQKDLLITNKNSKKNIKGMQNFGKIVLCGLGIEANHAKIVKKGDKYFMEALSDSASQYTLVNGKPVYEPKQLMHNDRIILGINSVFIFKNMLQKTGQQMKVDYEFAVTERQMQMQNLSLIPPSTLNLFLPTSLIRDNKMKDIYGGPPTQGLVATKKLLAPEQQSDIMMKIGQIESQFSKLVSENQRKLKQKQQFYKSKLNQIKKQKQQQKLQMSTLQEKLMIKSLESQALKNKNAELENLKKKLSKYYDQKNKRNKARQSMLLDIQENRNSVAEEDLIGQFIDVQNPNKKQPIKTVQSAILTENVESYIKKKSNAQEEKKSKYQDLVIEEYQNNQDLLKASLGPGQSPESLLLASEVVSPQQIHAQQKLQQQIIKNNYQLLKLEELQQKMNKFQFRRLYNIKIVCQVDQQISCQSCSKLIMSSQNVKSEQDKALEQYISFDYQDAPLQELYYQNKGQKKVKNKIKQEELIKLEQELKQLESKLIARESRISINSQMNEDQMLLNYSMDKPPLSKQSFNSRQSVNYDRRSSFSIRKFSSDSEFQLNLTQSQQVKNIEMKRVVSEFIQILADLPELNITQASNIKVEPTIKQKQFQIRKEVSHDINIQGGKNNLAFCRLEDLSIQIFIAKLDQKMKEEDEILLEQNEIQSVPQNLKQVVEFGINTEPAVQFQQERLKGASFTALMNEQFDHSHQNQTQFLNDSDSKQKNSRQMIEFGMNTQQFEYQKQTNQFGVSTPYVDRIESDMVTNINLQTCEALAYFQQQQDTEIEDYINSKEKEVQRQLQEEQINDYLQNQQKFTKKEIKLETLSSSMNTDQIQRKQCSVNTRRRKFNHQQVVDLKVQIEAPEGDQQIEKYLQNKEEEDQIENYMQKQQNVVKTQQFATNTQNILQIVSNSIQIVLCSSIQQKKLQKNKVITSCQIDFCFVPESRNQCFAQKQLVPPVSIEGKMDNFEKSRETPEMIDQQVQYDATDVQKIRSEEYIVQSPVKQHESSEEERSPKKQVQQNVSEQPQKQLNNSRQFADKFNLSVSQIQKHQLSYQDVSVFGFDGLLKEDELNNKIKLLEDKIKELQSQAQIQPSEQKQLLMEQHQGKEKATDILAQQSSKNTGQVEVPLKKAMKKKKKKHQMTPEQRREYEIQKELQAKIIQCNNQNIINQRNIQIHKRKRQADELRKILIKKQKVELQKQLLVLIPMIRRFNLIAREMKRLIQGKISIEYRNFSHYQMVQILKAYTVNKKSSGDNIQIKIMIMNLEEGRVYIWPADVFKNRYEIAEQIFEKYLENQDSEVGKNRMLQDIMQKSKDPFWDPIDYVNHGHGYLSLEFLLYNVPYEGYISIVYKSAIVAKLFVSLTPVKIKRHKEEDQIEGQFEESSEMESIQIGNQRNLLQKDLYFTMTIESIKFMKTDERHKTDDGAQHLDLTSLNSNIMKYSISYELFENDYKSNIFTTPDINYVEEKLFKRIDYMRRHSFKNISESTLAYISDCPVKFTLNVMKQFNEQCMNASFNQDLSDSDPSSSELNSSLMSDSKSVKSNKDSFNLQDIPKQLQPKTDFSKKKATVIYENTEVLGKLQSEAKKQQQRLDKIKKTEEFKKKAAATKGKRESDKDKDCQIY